MSARDNSDKLNAEELEARDRAVLEASTAVSEVQAGLDAARNRNRERNLELGQLNTPAPSPPQPGASNADEQPIPDQAANTARIAELTRSIATEEENIATLNSQLSARQAEHRRAVEAQQELRSATDQTRTNNKQDALSVFGSFNGNVTAGGGTPTGGATVNTTLNLGKVFSTGVASQHLTEGIEQSSIVSALTQCLAAAQRAAEASPEADRPQTRQTLSLACAQAPTSHQ